MLALTVLTAPPAPSCDLQPHMNQIAQSLGATTWVCVAPLIRLHGPQHAAKNRHNCLKVYALRCCHCWTSLQSLKKDSCLTGRQRCTCATKVYIYHGITAFVFVCMQLYMARPPTEGSAAVYVQHACFTCRLANSFICCNAQPWLSIWLLSNAALPQSKPTADKHVSIVQLRPAALAITDLLASITCDI